MFTHILHPGEFFAELHRHMAPGAYLYLYNEPDEIEFLSLSQSMFSVLNPFHMQVVGSSSIVRALRANKFEIVFLGHDEKQIFCLCQYKPEVQVQPMTSEEKVAHLESYSRARDYSIMNLPVTVRGRFFSAEWPEVVKRSVVYEISKIDSKGRITPRRSGLTEN